MLENKMEQTIAQDELHEECGVFGIYDLDGQDVASTIYYGLFALQHRGQESCGIAVSETQGPNCRKRKQNTVKYPVLRIWGLSMKYLMQRNWSV